MPASAECRTSDLTLAEFKTLKGKMEAFNPLAQTPEEHVGGTLLAHEESIALFKGPASA